MRRVPYVWLMFLSGLSLALAVAIVMLSALNERTQRRLDGAFLRRGSLPQAILCQLALPGAQGDGVPAAVDERKTGQNQEKRRAI